MDYLLSWRMVKAPQLLRRRDLGLAEIAQQVGYRCARTFSVAFARQVGMCPGRYARAEDPADAS